MPKLSIGYSIALIVLALFLLAGLDAISKHLTVLTTAGLISQEKRGRVKWCKLEPDAMREASVWMQAFGQMAPLDLDAFEAFLKDQGLSDTSERP